MGRSSLAANRRNTTEVGCAELRTHQLKPAKRYNLLSGQYRILYIRSMRHSKSQRCANAQKNLRRSDTIGGLMFVLYTETPGPYRQLLEIGIV